MAMRFLFLIYLALLWANPATAYAQNTPLPFLGQFGVWQAYSFSENGQPVCYMVTTKYFPHAKNLKRGLAALMITHRPYENTIDVVSYSPGYNLDPLHDVTIKIGTDNFSLFADQDRAWTRNTRSDHALTVLIRGANMVSVTSLSSQKDAVLVTDELDISGSSDAYHAISKACGLEPTVTPKPAAKHKVKPAYKRS